MKNMVILSTVTCLMLLFAHPAAALNLKTNSIVTDSTIKLSDIFIGLSETREDKILGPAPRPGKDMVLNARTLLRIATALDLPWRPQHAGEHVVLSRSASVVDYEMIEAALKSGIAHEGDTGTYQISFSGPLSEMILPPEHEATVELQSLTVRKGGRLFDAVLVAPSKALPLQTLHVSGALHKVLNVPVLRETMREGTVISKRDIEMIPLRETDLQADTVINAGELIGMTPRRMVFSGKPVKLNDLEAPQIVQRGDLVTMTFDHGGMTLSAQGKALESGAKGDHVRVSNLASSQTVQAIIVAERLVAVRDF